MGWKEYGYPENLKNLLNNLEKKGTQKEIKDIHLQIDSNAKYFRELVAQHKDKAGVTWAFLKQADYEMEKHKKVHPNLAKDILCRKGCSFCCEQNVSISPAEAELLVKATVQDNIDIDWSRIERLAALPENPEAWANMPRAERQCVFLDPQEKACRVYQYRPGVCRTYFSVDEKPEYCDVDGPVHQIKRFFCALADLIVAGIWNAEGPRTIENMCKALVKARRKLLVEQALNEPRP